MALFSRVPAHIPCETEEETTPVVLRATSWCRCVSPFHFNSRLLQTRTAGINFLEAFRPESSHKYVWISMATLLAERMYGEGKETAMHHRSCWKHPTASAYSRKFDYVCCSGMVVSLVASFYTGSCLELKSCSTECLLQLSRVLLRAREINREHVEDLGNERDTSWKKDRELSFVFSFVPSFLWGTVKNAVFMRSRIFVKMASAFPFSPFKHCCIRRLMY